MKLLQMKDVSVKKHGQVILNQINFNLVNQPSLTCLIGHNGSGKTTLIKTILGFLAPASGQIISHAQQIAYVPDIAAFDPNLTAFEVLNQCLLLADKQSNHNLVQQTLVRVGLDSQRLTKQLVKTYSRGMQQKLNIAAALIIEPDFLILDEPTSALDPQAKREILDLLTTLKSELPILVASHDLESFATLADSFLMLANSKLIWQGTRADLTTQVPTTMTLTLTNNEACQSLQQVVLNSKVTNNQITMINTSLEKILPQLLPWTEKIQQINYQQFNLSDFYLSLLRQEQSK